MADRHLRFTLPDLVAATEQREHAPGSWLSHVDARTSVMVQVPEVGAFVRALLPVRLTDGSTVTFGVWVSVHPAELQRAAAAWDRPDYRSLALDGLLANAVPPWGLLDAPVHLEVREARHTPYCASSPDAQLARVLTEQWPAPAVLTAISGL
jgi:hypothetical protein